MVNHKVCVSKHGYQNQKKVRVTPMFVTFLKYKENSVTPSLLTQTKPAFHIFSSSLFNVIQPLSTQDTTDNETKLFY